MTHLAAASSRILAFCSPAARYYSLQDRYGVHTHHVYSEYVHRHIYGALNLQVAYQLITRVRGASQPVVNKQTFHT
jgi:hypothetical protein